MSQPVRIAIYIDLDDAGPVAISSSNQAATEQLYRASTVSLRGSRDRVLSLIATEIDLLSSL